MNFGERVVEAREKLGYGQAEFATKIELAAQSLSRYEKNKVKPSVDFITKLTDLFSINANWLLTGQGEILLQDEKKTTVLQDKSISKDVVSINFYPDIYAAAGYGAINEYDSKPQLMTFDRKFLDQFLNVRSFDRLDIIRVVGDSMEPFIHNGEYVIVERSTEAYNGETIIANIDGQVYIKRFQADPLKRWIKLISDNNLYGDITLDTPEHISTLSIIGVVRAKIKPF